MGTTNVAACDMASESLSSAGTCLADSAEQLHDSYLLTLRNYLAGNVMRRIPKFLETGEKFTFTHINRVLMKHVGKLILAAIQDGVGGDFVEGGGGHGGLAMYVRGVQRLHGAANHSRVY